MLNLTQNEKEFIRVNFENGQELIDCDDIGILLDELDSLIMRKGHDKNQDITDVGRSMETIYDNIYNNN